LQSGLAFLFVLGVLIFVHELGHFLAARRVGVRVLTFSLGFGPKLLRVRRGDTEYCISAVPLGGYVKMAGETVEDPRSGQPDEFLSKSKWQRFFVLIMGPVMNVLLAFFVMVGVLYYGAQVPVYESQPPVIGTVLAESPAARAGLQVGDRIVAVGDERVATWERFFMAVMPRANRPLAVTADRNGAERTFTITPDAKGTFDIGDMGVLPIMHPQVTVVNSGQVAAQAGILVDDVVVRLNGREVTSSDELVTFIHQHADVPIVLTIRRQAGERDITVVPKKQGDRGLIGVQLSPAEMRTIKPGFSRAITMSLERNLEWSTLIFKTLAGLFSGHTSPKQLMGPVAIAQLSGDAAQIGWVPLLNLLAMISLNLGIINLLPIPVLDGGHIFIMALEGLARRDFSTRMKEKMLFAGFVVLMMLMVTVIYNDLTRIAWIERLMPWR
jgi:regulator of sigma E protease